MMRLTSGAHGTNCSTVLEQSHTWYVGITKIKIYDFLLQYDETTNYVNLYKHPPVND